MVLGNDIKILTKLVLNDISLTVEQGEFVCVVGKSGCGKSTLLKLIAGLEAPSYGQMLLNGKPITKPGADRVVMFQEHALFPWLPLVFQLHLVAIGTNPQILSLLNVNLESSPLNP